MEPAASPSSMRRVLLLLVVLAGALVALSIVQRDRALEREYESAEDRAELYAATVVRSALSDTVVDAPLEGEDRQTLLAEVDGFVLTDPLVARVRLWGADGTLLFSTDPADQPGDPINDPAIDEAAGGRVTSRLVTEQLSPPPGREGGPSVTPLFQTFAPLLVPGSADPEGAVEIEHLAAAIEQRADDPWWVVQMSASGVAVLLAFLAFVSVARGLRRPRRARARSDDRRSRRSRGGGWDDGDASELRERLERATTRAQEGEATARSLAAKLQQVTARLEAVEGRSSDERVEELKEALRRSEAERSMLRAGRPETQIEAEVRRLREQLRESQALARAAEAAGAGGGDLSAITEQLADAARQVDRAEERAKVAEGRADGAEDRARVASDLITAAEQRIDLLEAKLQEVVAAGVGATGSGDGGELERQLAEARRRTTELEERAAEAEGRLATTGSLDGPAEETLRMLEERLVAAESRAAESEARVRTFEDSIAEEGSAFRHRLGVAVGRKLGGATEPAQLQETTPDMDLRASIARGLRAPLTRASGLALSLQATVDSSEGKTALRQLSSSLRRLDQLAADLHDVHRIIDGSLPLRRRRTELGELVATAIDDAVQLEERLVRLDADTVHAQVDPARARQIVEGMLDAARERTRAGAAIVVRVRDTDAGARVSVEDDNRNAAAIGPELSLAVRLAELHGTEITTDGSSFRVLFPKAEGG